MNALKILSGITQAPDRKIFSPRPGRLPPPVPVYAPAAKVLKRVMAVPEGTEKPVPAKRQNRSSGNSTDDGVLKTKAHLIKEIHHDSTWS
ncbi:hypothetical protein [Pantoea sp. App145]|uniref:hypothetical protein n=1 Tax=Pantoea sp. App145 TaxID=3071567 RepID=UPI003A810F4D